MQRSMLSWPGLSVVLAVLLLPGTRSAAQTVRRVPGQYASIAAAISAAQPLDRIEVGPGRYQSINFSGKALEIVSTHGPRRTIIDGGGRLRAVTINQGEGPRTRLAGFTITNGNALTGAGIYCSGGAMPQIEGNDITRNRASSGAGVYIQNAGAVVRGNRIHDNVASSQGGGVWIDAANSPVAPLVDANYIHDNVATEGGGCAVTDGRLFNNWIYGNRATTGGGVQLTKVGLVVGNTIVENYGHAGAGGVYAVSTTRAAVVNCIVAGNVAPNNVDLPNVATTGLTVSHNATPRGIPYGQNNLTLSPGFVDSPSGDYHLRVDSPLRDRGDASFAAPTDFDGGPRVVGAGIDIGADEIDDVLYAFPGSIDGAGPTLRVIGRPGDSVYWTTSAGLLPRAIALPPFGRWFLQSPIGPIRSLGQLPAGGFRRIDLPLSAAQRGQPLAMQAMLVGAGGGRLSNAFVLSDTQPVPVHRVPGQHATIQAAIDTAAAGERVEVAAGTYAETIDFRGKGVYVVATGGPGATTIDANWAGEVVKMTSGEPGAATLDGFTLINGWGGIDVMGKARPTIVRNRIVSNGNTGIECGRDTHPIIRDNYIANNNSNFGGGILAQGRALVLGNEITGNTSSYGGGLHLRQTPLVLRNRIHRNMSRVLGGGAYVVDAPAFLQNHWYRNTAQQQAPAIFFAESRANLLGNTISGNSTSTLAPAIVFDRVRGGDYYDNIVWPDRTRSIASVFRSGGNVTVNPTFVDPAGDDYHLTRGSAAIDAARLTMDALSTDFEGDLRPLNNRDDAGADERAPHLYHVGPASPGTPLRLRVIGAPSTAVTIAFGTNARTVPLGLGRPGFLRIAGPIGILANGRVAANGVLALSIPIPAGFPKVSIPLQALIGSTLSNLDVVEIR